MVRIPTGRAVAVVPVLVGRAVSDGGADIGGEDIGDLAQSVRSAEAATTAEAVRTGRYRVVSLPAASPN